MKIVIAGGGMVGLCAGMLLAKDGHEVTLLERDGAAPPDPDQSWTTWERRGVNQFRLPHFFLARFRSIADAELPELVDALAAAGACRYNVVDNIPDEMKGGSRPDDNRFDAITGRRTVVESVTARVAGETPGLTVRRGAAVRSLMTGPSAHGSVPNAVGVELENGEHIDADLVVDATGRRSPLPRWIAEAGGPPVREELEDSGFMYYGRHFKSADGSLPPMFGPLKQDYGSVSALTLPADNGTWSVTIIASSKDSALRAASDPKKWESAIRMLPLAAHWIDGEPIDDGVAVMAKIEDRIRDYAPGGKPVATGALAVGDSWSCTNPSLGRGASIGLMHAALLRDAIRDNGDSDPWKLASAWYELTRKEIEPYYRATLGFDRARLAEVDAIIAGKPFTDTNSEWSLTKALEGLSLENPDFLRANIEMAMLLRRSDEVAQDPAVKGILDGNVEESNDQPPLGPTRTELLAAIS
jgi:2-polyprenyl-6-methoxyphenol hydroxylase-like FAD-dependent oxidoreductase